MDRRAETPARESTAPAPPPAGRRVVAAVLTHQRKDDLLENLASLAASELEPSAIVVFVNGCTDGTADGVAEHFPNAELIRSDENLGLASARNASWRHAESRHAFDYLLFLDDDTIVTPSCIGRMVEAFEAHPEAGVVGAKAFADRAQTILCSAGIRTNFYTGGIEDLGSGMRDSGLHDGPREVDAVGGFAQMIRRSAFASLGGFDERFDPYGWEDVDFCLRARAAGMATRYAPDAVVVHRGTRIGRGPVARYERAKAANLPRLLARHSSPLQKLCLVVAVPMRMLALSMRMLASGNAAIIPAQIAGLLTGRGRSKRDAERRNARG